MSCSMMTCCYPMIDHNLTSNVNSSCIFLRYLQTKTHLRVLDEGNSRSECLNVIIM
jgi:hypothetical protein